MNQIEDMRLLVQTIDGGSFTQAAERLGLSKQYVAKRVAALEERLGARLLIRTTRSLRLTELGLRYYEQAQQLIEQVEALETSITQQNASPRGRLRIAAPMSFGTLRLAPALPRFLAAHPQVEVELELNDRIVDLIGEGFDVGVRIGTLADSTLIAQRVADTPMWCCASPDYVAQHGRPERPADLRGHACLSYGHQRHVEWRFRQDGKPLAVAVQGRLCANNGEVLRDAACAGLGVVQLPGFLVDEALADGRLVSVLDGYQPPALGIHTLYASHRQVSLAVRAFSEFMRSSFAAAPRGPHGLGAR